MLKVLNKVNLNLEILLLIVLVGASLRIYNLGKQSIWLDEARSFFRAQKNIQELWTDQIKESNPPLYDIIFHYYLRLFDKKNEFQIRLFSAMLGILIIPLAFIVGSNMFNQKVGLLFSSLIAISPYHIYYSQDAKMYSLLSLLSLGSFFLYYLSLKTGKRVYWVFYTFITILLIYCHNYGFLLFLAQIFIFIFFYLKYRKYLINFLLSLSVIFICFIPRINCIFRQISMDYNPWIRFSESKGIILTFKYFSLLCWHMKENLSIKLSLLIGLPTYAFIFAVPIFIRNKDKEEDVKRINYSEKLIFILLYLIMPLFIASLISLKKPIYISGRYDMSVFPAFYLMASLGLYRIKKPYWRNFLIGAILLTTSISLYNYYYIYEKSNDRKIAGYIESRMDKDDLWIFTDLTLASFRYYSQNYFYPNLFSFPVTDLGWLPRKALEGEELYVNNEINKLIDKIQPFIKKDSVIRVIYSDSKINRSLIEELKKSHKLLDIINFVPGRNDNQCNAIYIFR